MPLRNLFLFTHIEALQFIKDNLWIIIPAGGAIAGQYKLFMAQLKKDKEELYARIEKLSEQKKKENEELCGRVEKVEDVDKNAYPRFLELLGEVKELRETVKNHHETRFTGIVNEMGNMRDKYDYRFADTDKAIANINRNFEKLEDKIDRNAAAVQADIKQIMAAIMKINRD